MVQFPKCNLCVSTHEYQQKTQRTSLFLYKLPTSLPTGVKKYVCVLFLIIGAQPHWIPLVYGL